MGMNTLTVELSQEKWEIAFQTLLLLFGNATMVRLVLEEAEREAKQGQAFLLEDARGRILVDFRDGMRVESEWNEKVGVMVDVRAGIPAIGDLCWVRSHESGLTRFFVAEFAGTTLGGAPI